MKTILTRTDIQKITSDPKSIQGLEGLFQPLPGPYAGDSDAAADGVLVNASYRRSDGLIAWRQS